MKKQIVIIGATGLIGSELTKQLVNNYNLILLTRNPQKYASNESIQYKYWDGKSPITEILNGCYAVVNLLGENIGKKRWSKNQKELILNSREDAAQGILKSIEECNIKPQVWVQASATGYYGQDANSIFNEDSPKGKNSFLADVCELWEKSINDLDDTSVRKVIIRTGVVLAKKSDLWKQLTMSFNFGVAAIPGSGKKYLPWIHIDDEVSAIVQAIQNNSYEGIFNLAAPNNATMKQIVNAIKIYHKSFITLPIPAFVLEILFGKEMTKEIVLTDQQVVPQHLIDKQFKFKYENIQDAVKALSL